MLCIHHRQPTHSDAAGSHDSAAAIMEGVSQRVYSTGYPLTIHRHGYTRRGLSKLQWGDTDVETCKLHTHPLHHRWDRGLHILKVKIDSAVEEP